MFVYVLYVWLHLVYLGVMDFVFVVCLFWWLVVILNLLCGCLRLLIAFVCCLCLF